MNIMTKRGNLDNIVTYEHICDTKEDLAKINKQYATLGSVAIVIKGEDDLLEAYMATSKGEWVPIMVGGNASGGGGASCNCQHLVLQEHYDGTQQRTATLAQYALNYTFANIEDALQNGTVVFNSELITDDDSGEDESPKKGMLKTISDSSSYIITPVQIGYNANYNYYFVTALGIMSDEYTWICYSKNDYPYRAITKNDDEDESPIIIV